MSFDTSRSDQSEAFIDLAYRLILQRPADAAGISHYKKAFAAGLPPVELLSTLLDSEEYRQKHSVYDYTKDPEILPYLTPTLQELSARLQACNEIELDRYETSFSKTFIEREQLVIGQREYGPVHKQRFWELVNAFALLIEGKGKPRVLEIGASEFSGIYKTLFPHIQLDIVDRPYADDYVGFTEAVCRRISGCETFYAVDLADYRMF